MQVQEANLDGNVPLNPSIQINDQSLVVLSNKLMLKLGWKDGNSILLTGNMRKKSVGIVMSDTSVGTDCVILHPIMISNLR